MQCSSNCLAKQTNVTGDSLEAYELEYARDYPLGRREDTCVALSCSRLMSAPIKWYNQDKPSISGWTFPCAIFSTNFLPSGPIGKDFLIMIACLSRRQAFQAAFAAPPDLRSWPHIPLPGGSHHDAETFGQISVT